MASDLDNIVVFIKVVEAKSFAAAAKKLGMSTASVSKHVSRLEAKLGIPLLNRSTHRVNLTEGGAELFKRCRRSLLEIEDAQAAARKANSALEGTLHIHIIPGIGQRLIEPAIIDFLRIHTNLSVELSISPETVNPLDRGLDLAFRSGTSNERLMRHSSLGFRVFGPLQYVICASTNYLKTHGHPREPKDLMHHNCLIQSIQQSPRQWWFQGPTGEYAVPVQGNFVSNSHTAIAEAMRAGVGIARLLGFNYERSHRGVEPLFQDLIVSSRMMHAFYPRAEPIPAKVAIFLDFVEQWLLKRAAQRKLKDYARAPDALHQPGINES